VALVDCIISVVHNLCIYLVVKFAYVQLTPWNRDLAEKLAVAELDKNALLSGT
jgi:hypothetical protein